MAVPVRTVRRARRTATSAPVGTAGDPATSGATTATATAAAGSAARQVPPVPDRAGGPRHRRDGHRRPADRPDRRRHASPRTTPSALRIGFVADLVREDLGAALTEPAVGIRRGDRLHGRRRRHARDARAQAARGGRDRERARVPVRGPDVGPRLEAHRRASSASRATSRSARSSMRSSRTGSSCARSPSPSARACGWSRSPPSSPPSRAPASTRPSSTTSSRSPPTPSSATTRGCSTRTSGPRARPSRASCTRPPTTSGRTPRIPRRRRTSSG